MNRRSETVALPEVSYRLLRWFSLYVDYYLRRNFHGLHLLERNVLSRLDGWPVMVCVNHPSWWDPLVGLHLSQRFFRQRRHYAPIAAIGFAKYGFFQRLGFFPIEPGTRSGAFRFLHLGETLLASPETVLWVTPQGHFRDVRERPVHLEPGVGHLAHRLRRFAMLPLALEYAFWNERYPEAFACFGPPVFSEDGSSVSPDEWNQFFASSLEQTQDHLARHVIARNPDVFEALIAGRSGVGGLYDIWRAARSRLQGKRFEAGHGRG